jgi:hypothetical protein
MFCYVSNWYSKLENSPCRWISLTSTWSFVRICRGEIRRIYGKSFCILDGKLPDKFYNELSRHEHNWNISEMLQNGILSNVGVQRKNNAVISLILLTPSVILFGWKVGRYDSNASYFFSENIIIIVMTFTYILGASFENLKLFYHKFSFCSNTSLPPLLETLYAGRLQLFTESSEFFKYALLHFVARKTASLEFILQRAKKMEVGGFSFGIVGRMGTWSIFLCRRTLRIRCFNSFNVCTYRSEFIVAHIFKNSLKGHFTVQEYASHDFSRRSLHL